MNFNWTLSAGDLLMAATFIGSVVGIYVSIRIDIVRIMGDIRVLRHDLGNLKTAVDLQAGTLSAQGAALSTIAVQSQRLANVEEDIRELRHGRGFVTPTEWPIKSGT